MRDFTDDGGPLLVQMAMAVEEEWRDGDWKEMLEAVRLLQDFTRDRAWECVLWSRHDGHTWDEIAEALGMSRQAAWEKYRDVDDARGKTTKPTPAGMDGRQAHFEDVLLEALLVKWQGNAADLSQLYEVVADDAGPEWIDDQVCRHNQGQYEWQHDVRWSLLKLKSKGKVRQPRRGSYQAT